MEDRKQRIIVYVDGFNFYFGLKAKKWRKYYWLDWVRFFESFLKQHQELVALKYFSAIQKNTGKADRQDLFFQGNKLNAKFHLELGKFLQKKITCRNCQDTIIQFEEKETDVRIPSFTQRSPTFKNQVLCNIHLKNDFQYSAYPPIFFNSERIHTRLFCYLNKGISFSTIR
jgi:hypothetical protein